MLKNKINNKIYIGVTNNYKKRMRDHKGAYNQSLISRAIKKYGWDNFEKIILYETTYKDYAYSVAEPIFILEYYSNDILFGYNMTKGGEGTLGFSPSLETRQKMRDKKLGKNLTEEHKKKLSEANTGRVVAEETKLKISKANTGKTPWLGKKLTEEHKNKLSDIKAKDWRLLSPNGEIINIRNMRKFCIENNLHHSAITKVLQGTQKQHKNWRKVP